MMKNKCSVSRMELQKTNARNYYLSWSKMDVVINGRGI